MVAEAYARVAELAHVLGIENLNRFPGCWEYQVDKEWSFKLNPHTEITDGLPPFEMAVTFNGWPAGILHPVPGGQIAAGSVANENGFITAVNTAIRLAQKENQ